MGWGVDYRNVCIFCLYLCLILCVCLFVSLSDCFGSCSKRRNIKASLYHCRNRNGGSCFPCLGVVRGNLWTP